MLDKLIGAALQGLGGGGASGAAGGSPIMNVILQLLMSQMAGGGQQAAPGGGLGGLLGQVLGGGAGQMAGGRGGDPLGGLLSQVLGGVQGGGRGAGGNPLEALAGAILGGQGAQGGLGGLLSQLQSAGLGREADSWVSPGQNMSVDPGQLLDAFGRERMQGLAQQNGMDLNEMLAGLSQQLPQVVDQLTPQGRLPQANELQDVLGALLGGGTRRA